MPSLYRRPLLACLLTLLSSVLTPQARASAPDVFGLGSRAIGLGGAYTALADDCTAAFYNPSGLALAKGPSVTLGLFYAGSRLTISGVRKPLESPFGIILGSHAHIPLGGALKRRIAAGIAIYLPPDTVVREHGHAPQDAFFPLYDNRTQRLVALPAVAVRLTDRLAIGFGLNFFAGLYGVVRGVEGTTRAIEAEVYEDLYLIVSWQAGMTYVVNSKLRLAIAFRQAFDIPFRTPVETALSGDPVDLEVRSQTIYTPPELALGAALKLSDRLLLSIDLVLSFWSDYEGNYVKFTARLPVPEVRVTVPLDPKLPDPDFGTAVALKTGVEYRFRLGNPLDLVVRAGYAFESSPVPSQPAVTNMLDGFKHSLSLGLGFDLSRLAGTKLTIDLHGQAIFVGETTIHKDGSQLADEEPTGLGFQTYNPGYPSVTGGGSLFSAGLTLTVGL